MINALIMNIIKKIIKRKFLFLSVIFFSTIFLNIVFFFFYKHNLKKRNIIKETISTIKGKNKTKIIINKKNNNKEINKKIKISNIKNNKNIINKTINYFIDNLQKGNVKWTVMKYKWSQFIPLKTFLEFYASNKFNKKEIIDNVKKIINNNSFKNIKVVYLQLTPYLSNNLIKKTCEQSHKKNNLINVCNNIKLIKYNKTLINGLEQKINKKLWYFNFIGILLFINSKNYSILKNGKWNFVTINTLIKKGIKPLKTILPNNEYSYLFELLDNKTWIININLVPTKFWKKNILRNLRKIILRVKAFKKEDLTSQQNIAKKWLFYYQNLIKKIFILN